MKRMKFAVIAGISVLLAGCAQQEEPTVVRAEPVYDKFGGGSCEGELVYIPGTVPQLDECIPPEECEPLYDTAGNIIECIPPSRYPDPGSSDDSRSSTTGRTTTGRTSPTAGVGG